MQLACFLFSKASIEVDAFDDSNLRGYNYLS